MEIQKIILKDAVIDKPEVVSFIDQCINQINGFPGVDDELNKKGMLSVAHGVRDAYNNVNNNQESTLIIDTVDSMTLKGICKSAIDTLQDYEDLEIIMCITYSEAMNIIEKI